MSLQKERISISPKYRKRQKAPDIGRYFSPFFMNPVRASCPALPGSMTVEAALVLPLFLFAIGNLLSMILLFQTFSVQEARLHQTGRELSLLAYGKEDGEQDIRLLKVSTLKAPFRTAAFPTGIVANGCVMHKWIGYELEGNTVGGLEKREETVYITQSGTVYHRQRECRYLNPSIRILGEKEAQTIQNHAGGRYTACSICKKSSGGAVYVTDFGSRYHSTVSCGGLKRTISSVPLWEAVAQGRHSCLTCG